MASQLRDISPIRNASAQAFGERSPVTSLWAPATPLPMRRVRNPHAHSTRQRREDDGGRAVATKKPTEPVLAQRLRVLLKELDISQLEATRRMNLAAKELGMAGVNDTFIRDILNGKKRAIGTDSLVLLARAFSRNPNWLLGVDADNLVMSWPSSDIPTLGRRDTLGAERGLLEIVVVGRIETGRWFDPKADGDPRGKDRPVVRAAPVPGYAPQSLAAFVVEGRGSDLICPPGATAIVSMLPAGAAPDVGDGDYVLVERDRDRLIERSIRRIEQRGGRWILVAPSSDAALVKDEWVVGQKGGPRIVGVLAASQVAIPRRTKLG